MRRAVELGPSLTYAAHGLAMAEGANGNPEEALAWLDRLFRLSPVDPLLALAHLNRGLSLMALNRLDEAEESFRRGLEEAPELPYSHTALAVFHEVRGEHEQARSLIARMNEIRPEYSSLPSTRVFMTPEQYEAARSMLARLRLDAEPDA